MPLPSYLAPPLPMAGLCDMEAALLHDVGMSAFDAGGTCAVGRFLGDVCAEPALPLLLPPHQHHIGVGVPSSTMHTTPPPPPELQQHQAVLPPKPPQPKWKMERQKSSNPARMWSKVMYGVLAANMKTTSAVSREKKKGAKKGSR